MNDSQLPHTQILTSVSVKPIELLSCLCLLTLKIWGKYFESHSFQKLISCRSASINYFLWFSFQAVQWVIKYFANRHTDLTPTISADVWTKDLVHCSTWSMSCEWISNYSNICTCVLIIILYVFCKISKLWQPSLTTLTPKMYHLQMNMKCVV